MTKKVFLRITSSILGLLLAAVLALFVWYFFSYSFFGVVTEVEDDQLRCLVAYDDYYELTESMKQRQEQPVILLFTDRADEFEEGDAVFAFTNSSCLDSSPRQTGCLSPAASVIKS